jgi:hypothetical protein
VAVQGGATPTPIESEAISPLLAGRDALGTVQSGTVKSAIVQSGIGKTAIDASASLNGRAEFEGSVSDR